MTELTDLELCKRIAEIEGIEVFTAPWNKEIILRKSGDMVVQEYNPFKWSRLGPLMVKHKIEKHYSKVDTDLSLIGKGNGFIVCIDEHIPRAILECIMEANSE